MEFFGPTSDAFRLLFTGDADLWRIIFTSLICSVIALLLISPAAIALGFLIAKITFPGRRAGIPVGSARRTVSHLDQGC